MSHGFDDQELLLVRHQVFLNLFAHLIDELAEKLPVEASH